MPSPFKLSGVGRERRIALMSEEDESKRNDASKLFTPCKCGKGGGGEKIEQRSSTKQGAWRDKQMFGLQEVVQKLKSLKKFHKNATVLNLIKNKGLH